MREIVSRQDRYELMREKITHISRFNRGVCDSSLPGNRTISHNSVKPDNILIFQCQGLREEQAGCHRAPGTLNEQVVIRSDADRPKIQRWDDKGDLIWFDGPGIIDKMYEQREEIGDRHYVPLTNAIDIWYRHVLQMRITIICSNRVRIVFSEDIT